MARPILLGLALASVAPIVIAAIGAGLYGLRTPESDYLLRQPDSNLTIGFLAIAFGTVASAIFTPILIYGLYRLCRRMGGKSALAYGIGGLWVSVPFVGIALFLEWHRDYEFRDPALTFHIFQCGFLISGPAAALAFWNVVRPDIAGEDAEREIRNRRIGFRLLLAAVAGIVGSLVSLGELAPPENRLGPMNFFAPKIARRGFESARSTALIADLRSFALGEGARFFYFTTHGTVRPNLTLVQATMIFPDDAYLTVSTSENGEISTALLHFGMSQERIDTVWRAFNHALDQAIDRANALSPDAIPVIPSEGEGGERERPWWDWRLHR